MAAICPDCHHPDAVAYLVNSEGIHPFPCLECNYNTIHSRHREILSGVAPCATPACTGSVSDDYVYNAKGRLTRLNRQRCHLCGSREAREAVQDRSRSTRPVPDPRVQRQ
ncbi:hypothetical protein ACFXAZ_33450 [Streptomyces sp. NPDC059477]|uniref:hypothetical protein n=1 Tax=Streptomyces sp. NPDC059477 TaxID=3346847 RepID=UPI0036746831